MLALAAEHHVATNDLDLANTSIADSPEARAPFIARNYSFLTAMDTSFDRPRTIVTPVAIKGITTPFTPEELKRMYDEAVEAALGRADI